MSRVIHGSERDILDDALDRNREALITSVTRLTDSQSRRRLVPSATTPIGLVKHAAAAERFWFQRFLAGRDEHACDGPASPGKGSFAVGDDESLDDVVAEFRSTAAQSRAIAADLALDAVLTNSHDEPVSVRFVLQHMVEELARHTGHADILVEQTLADPGTDAE
ncbi:DinB family protein [Gordonia sp. DT219]|uniref:DinB family protein n=1 Tax=Gordonia sp. DT219 TaxID=3416658 RepID=UPI003CFA890C